MYPQDFPNESDVTSSDLSNYENQGPRRDDNRVRLPMLHQRHAPGKPLLPSRPRVAWING